jgi:SHS2 domain-containing protein
MGRTLSPPEAANAMALKSVTDSRQGNRGWSHFPHMADVGVCGYGPTVEAAYEEAAKALVAAMTDAPIQELTMVPIRCEAPDLELLLAEWLNALVFEMATRRMVFGRFTVRIAGTELVGEAWGEALNRSRHQPAAEVKGATYTALKVARDADGRWIARCVVDV